MRGCFAMIDEQARIVVPGTTESIAAARSFVRSNVMEFEPDRVDDIVLVVSELVTNAVQNGTGGDVEVGVVARAEAIEVSVSSESTGVPVVPAGAPSADAVLGRGLYVSATLSDDLAIASNDVTTVTCRFDLN